MAKKKNMKNNLTSLVMTAVIAVFSLLTICTLFMPVFKSITEIAIGGASSNVTGADIFAACFTGEYNKDASYGVNALVALKNGEESAFVSVVFCWAYLITVILSVVTLASVVLSLVGINFNKVQLGVGALLVVVAIVTFIFGFIVCGKFASIDLGVIVKSKTVASIGNYLMLGTIVGGCGAVYSARK